MGKVVILGTPNQGSKVADFWEDNFLYKYFYGPAGQQLVTNQLKFKELYGKIDYPLGIVAGSFSIDPFSSFIIPSEDDGKVYIESTKIKGMKDHVVISASHTFMVSNNEVKRQVLYFIEHGKFLDTQN